MCTGQRPDLHYYNCTLGWLGLTAAARSSDPALRVRGVLPPAMVWSLVYRYIEGRRCSDASGRLRHVGHLRPGVSKLGVRAGLGVPRYGRERVGVPFVAGALFFLPGYVLCIWGLEAARRRPRRKSPRWAIERRTTPWKNDGSTFFKVWDEIDRCSIGISIIPQNQSMFNRNFNYSLPEFTAAPEFTVA